MISILLNVFLNFVLVVCRLIMLPIDAIISEYLPDVSNMFDSVSRLFDLASDYLSWVINLSGLSNLAIQFIILYFGFKLTVPLSVHVIKFVIKWYQAIMP